MSARSKGFATVVAGLVVAITAVALPTTSQAAPPSSTPQTDRTLGNGLGRLLDTRPGVSRRAAGGFRIDQDALTIRDGEGRVLVDLTPQTGVDAADFRSRAERAGLVVRRVDDRRGTLEGFVALDRVRGLADVPGAGTLVQALKPHVSVGRTTSQGVALQRADKAQKLTVGGTSVDGRGVTIGVLSDSYDTSGRGSAAQDVASGDLPGRGNARNATPVVVLEDDAGGTDEGRAMLQIVHDVAPGAKLCFATADTGLVGFADNIRALADKSGPCGADVLVDDIGYYDEPMFSDSVVSDAIDDVTAAGADYYSAAGNDGVDQAWASDVSLVPATAAAKAARLDLSRVDPALYEGGLQDFDAGNGVDVAQEIALGDEGGLVDLQWDDPTDVDGASFGPALMADQGSLSPAESQAAFSFDASPDQVGTTVEFRTDGVPSGSTDLVLSVVAPDGTVVGVADDQVSPETVNARLRQAGQYTIVVSGYRGATGDFSVDVRPVLTQSKVTTDFNVLFFAMDGTYLGASADLNTVSGRPSEIVPISGETRVQLVIARSGGSYGAGRLRDVLSGDAAFVEHSDPLAPAVYGHPTARGATAVAAYDPFGPYLPEPFTSPGSSKLAVPFDSAGARRSTASATRQVPQVAGADGVDTTFFGDDTDSDSDSYPNFFGTSAAAPHLAGVAALVLQGAGGPTKLTPAALRTRLEKATFAHDLDPNRSSGSVSGVSLTASGAQGNENGLLPGSMTDKRFFTVSNTGSKTVKSLRLDGKDASPTSSDGIVFDPRKFGGRAPYDDDGFPFAIGSTGGGLKSSDVKVSYSTSAGHGRYRRMTITFKHGLKPHQSLQFGIDRDLRKTSDGYTADGNGADELGGATSLPSGKKETDGLAFRITPTHGKKKTGHLANKLGSGFSPVDGYGLVNAEAAVLGR